MAWVSEIALERHELGAVRLFGVEWRSVWRGPAPARAAEHRSGRVDELVFATAEDASAALEIVADLVSPQRDAIDPRDHVEIVRRYRRAALAMSLAHGVPARGGQRYPARACPNSSIHTSSTSTRPKKKSSAPASTGAAGTSR